MGSGDGDNAKRTLLADYSPGAGAVCVFGVNIVIKLTRQLAERARMRRQLLVFFRRPSYYSMLRGT